MMYKAYQGERYKLPISGDMAEKWAGYELGREERSGQQGDDLRGEIELALGVKWQNGQDHSRAQHLHEDDEQDGDQAAIQVSQSQARFQRDYSEV